LKEEVNTLEDVQHLVMACYNIPHGLTAQYQPMADKDLEETYPKKNSDPSENRLRR